MQTDGSGNYFNPFNDSRLTTQFQTITSWLPSFKTFREKFRPPPLGKIATVATGTFPLVP